MNTLHDKFKVWLQKNNRDGYIPAYNSIIKEPNNTLNWCDYEDLIAIFINLKESSDPNHYSIDDLSSLLSGLSVNQNQQKHSQ